MGNYSHRSKEHLRELYVEKELTQKEVAEKCGVTTGTISDWINRFEIETGYTTNDLSDTIKENYQPEKSFVEMAEGTKLSPAKFRYRTIKCGLHEPDGRSSYNKKELIEYLQQKSSDGSVSKRDISDSDNSPWPSVYQRKFGGWNEAVKEAGLEPNASSDDVYWTKEKLLSDVEEFASDSGDVTLSSFKSSEYGPKTSGPIESTLGSFSRLLRVSDVKPENYPSYAVQENTAIELLSERYEEVQREELAHDDDIPGPHYYTSHFGSVEESCRMAGVDYTGQDSYTEEDVKSALKSISDNGTVLSEELIDATISQSTVVRKSNEDTIKEAVEEFGFDYLSGHHYTEEELIQNLRECKRRYGEVKVGILKQDNEFPSWMTYIKRFGSWSKAKEIAGAEPDKRGRDKEYKNGYDTYLYGPEFQSKAEEVRNNTNRQCQSCGIEESELNQKLDVHHIQPVRSFENTSEAHTYDNLVALCHSCHMAIEADNIECPEPPRS